MIAEVIFNLPIDRAFHYAIPKTMETRIRAGMRVVVPFGPRRLIGLVSRLRSTSQVKHPKPLLRLIDENPALTQEHWRLARWVSSYYYCSLGEACASMVPAALRIRINFASPACPPTAGGADRRNLSAVEEPVMDLRGAGPDFTAQQRNAFAPIEAALRAHRHQTFLLHGITGSGKTELYLRAIGQVLNHGRSAICLVPEIALTPQALDRFRQRFGSEVSVWHSRLTLRQRADQWQRLAAGQSHIVVGTRSAVFAPVERLGLITLDEEHDPSYKQDKTPRYHARDVAIARARMAGAAVILGSATPSIESYYSAKQGRYHLLELTERIKGRKLPHVNIIDMRQELASRKPLAPLSGQLQAALRRIVELKEQAILLLNRRGFARVILCPVCGFVVRCRQCTVPLIYHAALRQVLCHYCNARQTPPEACPGCQRGYLRFRGAGTERIESELHRLFPASGIARMDTDTTKARESHRQLYDSITTQQIDLLVGTQMVAKGLDIPTVTLVGVVSADTALNLPDFRAGERTFNLLTQVAGRAGRGDRPGQVLIQTYCPDHYAIRAASRHDYHEFYRTEIQMRKRLKLPPFVHLIELTIQGRNLSRVQPAAESLAEMLSSQARRHRIALLGPAPHRVKTLRGLGRWRMVMKGRSVASMVRVLRHSVGQARRFHGLPVIVDVDPL